MLSEEVRVKTKLDKIRANELQLAKIVYDHQNDGSGPCFGITLYNKNKTLVI